MRRKAKYIGVQKRGLDSESRGAVGREVARTKQCEPKPVPGTGNAPPERVSVCRAAIWSVLMAEGTTVYLGVRLARTDDDHKELGTLASQPAPATNNSRLCPLTLHNTHPFHLGCSPLFTLLSTPSSINYRPHIWLHSYVTSRRDQSTTGKHSGMVQIL